MSISKVGEKTETNSDSNLAPQNPAIASATTHKNMADPISETLRSKLSSAQVQPGLYIVPTPIGNLADITLRAIVVLKAAKIIVCEDSRITGKLKKEFHLSAQLIPYHDHNAKRSLREIIEKLKNKEIVALVSDAGTPLISDPGYRLVNAAINEKISVISLPGPSALLTALTASGLPTNQFLFVGFLPTKQAARQGVLKSIANIRASLIFFENPKRLDKSLSDLAKILGKRKAVIARELTKLHEEISRGTLCALAEQAKLKRPPKGEVTILISPPIDEPLLSEKKINALLKSELLETGVAAAASAVAGLTGISRKELYRRAVTLQKKLKPKNIS